MAKQEMSDVGIESCSLRVFVHGFKLPLKDFDPFIHSHLWLYVELQIILAREKPAASRTLFDRIKDR